MSESRAQSKAQTRAQSGNHAASARGPADAGTAVGADADRSIAVVIDISQSRAHPDRAGLQAEVSAAFATVNTLMPAMQPIEATIGDEFQAVYADILTALPATLLALMLLPDGVECRFGLGEGAVREVGESRAGLIQDGPGWWNARDAVQQARKRQYARLTFVRTWFVGADRSTAALVNAYLVCRDQIVSDMKPRARRILRGLLMNQTQTEIAAAENVTQSTVSQTLHNSGAIALLASTDVLTEALAESLT